MALLPSTPESRMVPVAGRQFAERRLMRGAGAAERSVGHAWGRMTSRQREYYGNQRNFAGGLQREANRRGAQQEAAQARAERNQGRQDAMGDAPPAPAPPNHAQSVIAPPSKAFINKEVEDDMYPAGKPRPKPASEQLRDAREAGRVQDDAYLLSNAGGSEAAMRGHERGYDGSIERQIPDNDPADTREQRRLTKVYQMNSRLRFAERRQKPLKTGISY